MTEELWIFFIGAFFGAVLVGPVAFVVGGKWDGSALRAIWRKAGTKIRGME